ncbi:hypothetical protein AVEN_34259-1 [Araneus ventricosus]|uniref:Uncharacterized protein n=1 Tax=Araneus ventricosus TaxID=182803 RepID=A0A4Y2X899_ARAVE|nr:hypothetical protein AVEN_9027-1 [Araneus ventricosus]GBO45875.1 hypothetical protein AVEN_34259-1 [Araneus ventricosus]
MAVLLMATSGKQLTPSPHARPDMKTLALDMKIERPPEDIYTHLNFPYQCLAMDLMHVTSHPPTRDLPEAAIGQTSTADSELLLFLSRL